MKVSHVLDSLARGCRKLLVPLAAFLLLVLLLKQLQLYDWIVDIYKSCLPVLMGIVIAFLLQPLIDRLQQHVSQKLAVMLVYIGIALVLAVFVIGMIPIIYKQVMDFAEVVPVWMRHLEGFLDRYHIAIGNLETLKEKYLQEGYIIVIDSLRNTMHTATNYGIAYITAFFISIDLDFWKRTAKKVIPNLHQFSTFYLTMSNIVYQYLVGTFLDILFIVVTVGITLYIFTFPNALLYAVILALLNLFPYVGATFGLILIAIVGALSYPVFPFLAFAIVWTIQQIESNFIQPMIFNRTMHVRPILTFVLGLSVLFYPRYLRQLHRLPFAAGCIPRPAIRLENGRISGRILMRRCRRRIMIKLCLNYDKRFALSFGFCYNDNVHQDDEKEEYIRITIQERKRQV